MDKSQEEFLISKLLDVSENTIESLVKLRDELSLSSKGHEDHSKKIEKIIDNQRNIENLLTNFKERKPFDAIDRIEDRQEKHELIIGVIKERLFSNNISGDLAEIKGNVRDMKNKENMMRKWIIILSSISTLAVLVMSIYKIFF
jgi:hypothetical protein